MYTRIGIQIEFPRPHISDKYPDGNRACVVNRAKFASMSIERTGQRGCHLEQYSRKEPGSIFLRHGIKKVSGFNLAFTRFKIHNVIKNFRSGEQIQKVAGLKKLRIRMPDSPNTCGRASVSGKKKLRIQKYPDTCGRSLK